MCRQASNNNDSLYVKGTSTTEVKDVPITVEGGPSMGGKTIANACYIVHTLCTKALC